MHLCMCIQPAGAGGWSSLVGRGGQGEDIGGGCSLTPNPLSVRLSTESSAVPPSTQKTKYYYLCPLSIITSPLSIITFTLKPRSDHHYMSADKSPLPIDMNSGLILWLL